MHATHLPTPRPLTLIQASAFRNFRQSITETGEVASQYAIAEINAYITIRDDLLEEAGKVPTCAKLDSVAVANDFVETCLRPPRPSYKTQHLSQAEAAREQMRCNQIRERIVELRARARSGQPA